MNYSLISLLLISVCLLGQNIVATESEADCEFDLNKSVQSRKSHENNNKHYYECESNGLFVKKQCADGLLFDEDVLTCVNNYNNLDLLKKTQRLSSWQSQVCKDKNDGDKIPNYEDNCQSFFICKQGVPDESSCATGLLYSPLKGHCDWPKDVRCICKGVDCPSNVQDDTSNDKHPDPPTPHVPLPHPPSPAPTLPHDPKPSGSSTSSSEIENADITDHNLPTPPTPAGTVRPPSRPMWVPEKPIFTYPTAGPGVTAKPSANDNNNPSNWGNDVDQICVEGTPEGNPSGDQPITPTATPPSWPTHTPTASPPSWPTWPTNNPTGTSWATPTFTPTGTPPSWPTHTPTHTPSWPTYTPTHTPSWPTHTPTPSTPSAEFCSIHCPCPTFPTTTAWPTTSTFWSSTTFPWTTTTPTPTTTTTQPNFPTITWTPPNPSNGCPPWGCVEIPTTTTDKPIPTPPSTTEEDDGNPPTPPQIPTAEPPLPTPSTPNPNTLPPFDWVPGQGCPPNGCHDGRPEENIHNPGPVPPVWPIVPIVPEDGSVPPIPNSPLNYQGLPVAPTPAPTLPSPATPKPTAGRPPLSPPLPWQQQ